jgi:hypothetical protein
MLPSGLELGSTEVRVQHSKGMSGPVTIEVVF